MRSKKKWVAFSWAMTLVVLVDLVLPPSLSAQAKGAEGHPGAAAARQRGRQGTALLRGPYLQRAAPTAILVCWRTDLATDSRVFYGSEPGNLTEMVTVAGASTEHRVTLSGLLPDTRYYYAVGSSAGQLFGDASTFFTTPPLAGATQKRRLWVIGDSGRADINAVNVYQAFETWNGGQRVDGWLMLGDNAYLSGTDAEYQAAVFDIYPKMLRQVGLFTVYGNHDGVSASAATQTGPYFDIFEPPAAGQVGGLASGTEAYYSFDLGNLHLVVLDSYESSRAPNGAMATWLDADLAATTADWIVVAFHHPPYSKGSHNSDTELELMEMRQNLVPIFESRGVDLVLSGHSHAYERSMLIDGHYGLSPSFSPEMIRDGGDGRIVGDGVYLKPAGLIPHEGTVYAVVGISSTYSLGGSLDHPVMLVNFRKLGSLLLEVEGNRLDARLIDVDAQEVDHFTLAKGPDPCPESDLVAAGAIWKYRDDGVDLGTSWRQEGYNDAGWSAGPAELGYGDGDEATVVGFGPNAGAKYPTTYFRHSFEVADPAAVETLEASILRDDAVALYLNGTPVVLDNFDTRTPQWGSWAQTAVGGAGETEWHHFRLDKSLLHVGTNVLAAEIHQAGPTSSDISFDLNLRARSCSQLRHSEEHSPEHLGGFAERPSEP